MIYQTLMKENGEAIMIHNTNNKEREVIYGESPHLIMQTANCQIILSTEHRKEKIYEDYVIDKRVEGGNLAFQQ